MKTGLLKSMQALHDGDFLYLEMYMRCMSSKITPWDDANVPTTVHNPQTAHSATIANTHFCSISTEAELKTSSGPR
jgi:hypothetical protein